MTKKLVIAVLVVFVFGFMNILFAQDTKSDTDSKKVVQEPNQAKCPVMGGKINKKVFTDHDGKRIYFCCPGCDSRFKKDAEKYLKKMEKEGIVLENSPAKEKTSTDSSKPTT